MTNRLKSLRAPAQALALAGLWAFAGPAQADQNSPLNSSGPIAPAATNLPTFAQAPSGPDDPWAGFSAGGDFAVVGGKGLRGGVGGDAWIGYDKELPNRLVVSVQAVSGYAPNLYKYSRINGFDYAGVHATVGYDMGRFEPYVLAGVDFAKANIGAPGLYNTSQSLDDIFNRDGAPLLTATTVGAGFNYQITPNVSMGLSVSATQVNGGSAAPAILPP